MVARSGRTGRLFLYRGNGTGHFAAPRADGRTAASARCGCSRAVGDITGDGYPDLMGQPRGGSMRIYPSNGATGFRAATWRTPRVTADQQLGVGLWNGDGSPDSLVRRSDGSLVLYPGNGPGGLTGGGAIGSARQPATTGWWPVGDVTGDGRPTCWSGSVHRHALDAAGHLDRVRGPRAAHAGGMRALRPRRLTGPTGLERQPAQLLGGPLLLRPAVPAGLVGVPTHHGGAAVDRAAQQGHQPAAGARVHVGEQPPTGGDQRRLRPPRRAATAWVDVPSASRQATSSACRRVAGGERVGLREHHGAVVGHARSAAAR